jgi:GntR family transcriptional repressor for pyruvate dehydrogenase complex
VPESSISSEQRVPTIRDVSHDRGLSAFRPVRVPKVSDEVVAAIVDAIRSGLYEPGDKLPRERDLAATLEVSRANVREAVRVLERAGILSVRRGNAGGAVVETRWIPSEIVKEVEGEKYLTLQTVLEVRRPLELAAALLAAERATEDDLRELRRLVSLLDGLMSEPDEFVAVDTQFHLKVADAARNSILAGYVISMWSRFLMLRAHYPTGHVDLNRARENQQRMLAALESRDPKRITEAVDEHVGSSEEYFLGKRLS